MIASYTAETASCIADTATQTVDTATDEVMTAVCPASFVTRFLTTANSKLAGYCYVLTVAFGLAIIQKVRQKHGIA